MRTDSELMNAFTHHKDSAAFNEIVERYRRLVWKVAFRFTADEADSQDILQDTFIRLIEAAPRYKASASLSTFIYHIVTNLCLDFKKKKRPVAIKNIDLVEDNSHREHDEMLDNKNRLFKLSEALRTLPDRQRMAIIYKYDQNCTTHEIAAILHASEKAVERLLSHGREGLKVFFEKNRYLEGDFK